jgi:adenylate cyclase
MPNFAPRSEPLLPLFMARHEMDSLKVNEHRLWQLVAARSQAGVDVAALDRRIWDLFGERWAVVYTDLSGFSRQVDAFGILHFLQIIYEHKVILEPIIAEHDGVLVKSEADSLLILFRRPAAAWSCCVRMQQALHELNQHRLPEHQVLLCAGIGYGDVLKIGDTEVYGQQINAASKLGEDTAKAYEILVTTAVQQELANEPGFSCERVAVDVLGTGEAFRVHYHRGA